MINNIKSILYSIRLMQIGSMLPSVVLFISFVNIVNAFTGYNMEMLDVIWIPLCVAAPVAFLVSAIVIAMNYTNNYKFFIALPMKLDKIPSQMMLLIDFIFLSVTIIDLIVMASFGMAGAILVKLSTMFILYAASSVVLYISTRTGFKSYGITGKVVSAIILFLIYAVCTTLYIASVSVIYEYFEEISDNKMISAIIFAVAFVVAVIFRILSYIGVRNCVRQSKIYKTKKSLTKSESYV